MNDKTEIQRRPYQNQKERDLELCKAYQRGILDERKIWERKPLLKRKKAFCFCMGDRTWTPMCGECQDFFQITNAEITELQKTQKNKIKKEDRK